jgi:hypothetical protein
LGSNSGPASHQPNKLGLELHRKWLPASFMYHLYSFSCHRPATGKQAGDAASRPLQSLTLEVECYHHQMEVIMAFLTWGRKAGERDLGAQLSAVTERCAGQEARGSDFPAGTGVLFFQFHGCQSKREGNLAGFLSGMPWWKRLTSARGAVWDAGRLRQGGQDWGRPDSWTPSFGHWAWESAFPLCTVMCEALAPCGSLWTSLLHNLIASPDKLLMSKDSVVMIHCLKETCAPCGNHCHMPCMAGFGVQMVLLLQHCTPHTQQWRLAPGDPPLPVPQAITSNTQHTHTHTHTHSWLHSSRAHPAPSSEVSVPLGQMSFRGPWQSPALHHCSLSHKAEKASFLGWRPISAFTYVPSKWCSYLLSFMSWNLSVFIHVFVEKLMYLLFHLFTYMYINLLIDGCLCWWIYLFMKIFIYSFMHLLI